MCKCQEPIVEQLKRIKMEYPSVEITVPSSTELNDAVKYIFGLPSDTGEKFQKAKSKMEKLEQRLNPDSMK